MLPALTTLLPNQLSRFSHVFSLLLTARIWSWSALKSDFRPQHCSVPSHGCLTSLTSLMSPTRTQGRCRTLREHCHWTNVAAQFPTLRRPLLASMYSRRTRMHLFVHSSPRSSGVETVKNCLFVSVLYTPDSTLWAQCHCLTLAWWVFGSRSSFY